jgi:hypothetical protein
MGGILSGIGTLFLSFEKILMVREIFSKNQLEHIG